MSAVKILHCADLHIGANESFLCEKAAARRIEALMTFERIVDLATENGVKLVLISGDLFDSLKIENIFVKRVIEKVESSKDITFVYCAGNHDPLNYNSPFFDAKLPENFKVLPTNDSVIEVFEGVKVYGRSFAEVLDDGEERFSLEPQENCINIMCIHGEYGFGSAQNPISNDFVINSNMDYIALGHVHQRSEPKKVGNTYIAYCGCPEGLGFDELGEKGVYIGEIDKNRCDLQFYKTSKRMHITENIDVSDLNGNMEISEKILSVLKDKYGEEFSENLYKIVLTGEVSEELKINTTELAKRIGEVTYFAKVKDKTSLKFNLDLIKNEMSLKGIFVSKMLEKMENEPENKERLQSALKIGLKAFSGEVPTYED